MKRLALAFIILACLSGVSVAQEKPNIVVVFMDNFGWGEPGFNGGGITRGAATPRLDGKSPGGRPPFGSEVEGPYKTQAEKRLPVPHVFCPTFLLGGLKWNRR